MYVFTLICFSFLLSFFCRYVSMRILVTIGVLVIVYQPDAANAFLEAGDLTVRGLVVQSATLMASAGGVVRRTAATRVAGL